MPHIHYPKNLPEDLDYLQAGDMVFCDMCPVNGIIRDGGEQGKWIDWNDGRHTVLSGEMLNAKMQMWMR